ncbi:cysteine-rich receptor-like protein kinase 10 isoform X2 [Panicum miliaceum]|uniref:Cysteine-rich receptor-like protein kinase 10 isoform X2 n=1 Tax=Panicum miliaceum TaxID=4540 RepID=A0A3L6QRQ0_PANMI|nr:cysteine-rich receptor-like protein kinase 10 isoform X2 [Panicum miliaceum]
MAVRRGSLRSSPSIVFPLLLSFLVAPPAVAQLPWTNCGDSGAFEQNSTYQSNLERASAVLPRNASSSASLFAAGAVGAAPDVVYALALCRGDASAPTCAACLGVAFQDAQQLCAYSREVSIYYDLCYLRFSGRDFLAGADNDEMYLLKTENVSAPTAAFDAAVGALLNATAGRAAADPTRRFATGEEAPGGSVPALYALAQCTPDMTPAGCRSCLANITRMARKLFSGSPSGRFIRVRCNYRYELQPFFSGSPLLQLPALASPPPHTMVPVPANSTSPVNGPGRKNRATKISVGVASSLFFMLIGLASTIICWKRKTPVRSQNS